LLAIDGARCNTGKVPHPLWPLFDLRICTPRLELRYPADDDIVELANLAATGIHDKDDMPFSVPWTRRASPQLERGTLQFHWLRRAEWAPARWALPCVVVSEGVVVGAQEIVADNFAIRRQVATGSWVGRAYQGRGIGKEMRAAVLHLAFAGLGAQRAFSSAFEDNPASLAVSRALGYEENGDELQVREGKVARMIRLKLTRERWSEAERDDIKIHKLEPCLELFGVAGTTS
jgi:RimJ/RimL family protein N-acetyltransferase